MTRRTSGPRKRTTPHIEWLKVEDAPPEWFDGRELLMYCVWDGGLVDNSLSAHMVTHVALYNPPPSLAFR